MFCSMFDSNHMRVMILNDFRTILTGDLNLRSGLEEPSKLNLDVLGITGTGFTVQFLYNFYLNVTYRSICVIQ